MILSLHLKRFKHWPHSNCQCPVPQAISTGRYLYHIVCDLGLRFGIWFFVPELVIVIKTAFSAEFNNLNQCL
jgi:hypothetical protein